MLILGGGENFSGPEKNCSFASSSPGNLGRGFGDDNFVGRPLSVSGFVVNSFEKEAGTFISFTVTLG